MRYRSGDFNAEKIKFRISNNLKTSWTFYCTTYKNNKISGFLHIIIIQHWICEAGAHERDLREEIRSIWLLSTCNSWGRSNTEFSTESCNNNNNNNDDNEISNLGIYLAIGRGIESRTMLQLRLTQFLRVGGWLAWSICQFHKYIFP